MTKTSNSTMPEKTTPKLKHRPNQQEGHANYNIKIETMRKSQELHKESNTKIETTTKKARASHKQQCQNCSSDQISKSITQTKTPKLKQ